GGSPNMGVLASAEVYDPATDSWAPAGLMNTAREHHTATALKDGRVLVVGGQDEMSIRLPAAEVYDPKSNSWAPAGWMDTGRSAHTATALPDGRVLVAGGIGN